MVWLFAAAGMIITSALFSLSVVQCNESKHKSHGDCIQQRVENPHQRQNKTAQHDDGWKTATPPSEPTTSDNEQNSRSVSKKVKRAPTFLQTSSRLHTAQDSEFAESHRARKAVYHKQATLSSAESTTGGVEKADEIEVTSWRPHIDHQPDSLYRPPPGMKMTEMGEACFYPKTGGPAPLVEEGFTLQQYVDLHAKLVLQLKNEYPGFAPKPKPYQFPVDLSLSESQR